MHRLSATLLTAFLLLPAQIFAATPAEMGTMTPLPFTIIQDTNVAFLRIGPFTPDIVSAIRPTLVQIARKKPRGLVLDFRNNQGGDFEVVHALLESLLPKGTPYIRYFGVSSRGIKVTAQTPVLKGSLPIVVLRNPGTINEPDIAIYALAKMRKAGVLEFSPGRAALTRKYKQDQRMDKYRPIKEGVFFVKPDARIIGDEGGSEEDMIGRAASLIREMSPWDEPKKSK